MKVLYEAALLGILVAAAPAAEPEIVFQKHTVVTFDGGLIDGSLQTPDATVIERPGRPERGMLIRIRQTFHERVVRSLPR